MSARDKLYKCFVKERDAQKKAELFTQYKKKRNMIISLIRRSKKDYYVSFFEDHKSNVKKTWEGIREIVSLSKKRNIVPSQIIYQNKEQSTNIEMASSMNDFFVNIGKMVEGKIPTGDTHFSKYLTNQNPNNIFLKPVDITEIFHLVKQINPTKACGPNSIPSNILKTNILYLSEPLEIILNKSINEGVFPNLMKLANVCPIFKKNDKNKCENYRPISLLSNLSKIFERAMHTRVYDFLDISNIIYKLQFGFRKRYSTNHNLLSIIEDIRSNLDNKTYACGVFIDLEKAFDTVNHVILLNKLSHYGIRGIANNWFSSYLCNRQQKVTLSNASSPLLDITCGVPQGSILGPLLFLIYINDMNTAVKNSIVHHFADDTNLLFSHKDPKLLRKKMNEDLQLIFNWLCANRLSLNVSKTEFIIFKPPKKPLKNRITLRLNGKVLHESKKIKYLGLILDDKLTWKFHINELRKKLNRSIGIMYKLKTYCSEYTLKSIYFSLIHSYISYGISVWGTASLIYTNQIRILQKKAIRIITNSDYLAHTKPLFKHLNILNFDDMIVHQFASLMWDHDHKLLPNCFSNYFLPVSEVHHYNTRMSTTGKLSENVRIRTETHGKKMLKFIGPRIFNSLKELDFYSLSKTKKHFLWKQYLLKKY